MKKIGKTFDTKNEVISVYEFLYVRRELSIQMKSMIAKHFQMPGQKMKKHGKMLKEKKSRML